MSFGTVKPTFPTPQALCLPLVDVKLLAPPKAALTLSGPRKVRVRSRLAFEHVPTIQKPYVRRGDRFKHRFSTPIRLQRRASVKSRMTRLRPHLEKILSRNQRSVTNKAAFESFEKRQCSKYIVHLVLEKESLVYLWALDANKRAQFMEMEVLGENSTKVPQERNLDASVLEKSESVAAVKKYWKCEDHYKENENGCYRSSNSVCRPLVPAQVVAWAREIRPPNNINFQSLLGFKPPPKKCTATVTLPDTPASEPSSEPPDHSLSTLEPFLQSFVGRYGKKTFEKYYERLESEDFLLTVFAEYHKLSEYGALLGVGMNQQMSKALCKYTFEVEEQGGKKEKV
ncbi:hypothetical protein P7C70_g5020, partial [Phenoliferia sp. Uapishka_3]